MPFMWLRGNGCPLKGLVGPGPHRDIRPSPGSCPGSAPGPGPDAGPASGTGAGPSPGLSMT